MSPPVPWFVRRGHASEYAAYEAMPSTAELLGRVDALASAIGLVGLPRDGHAAGDAAWAYRDTLRSTRWQWAVVEAVYDALRGLTVGVAIDGPEGGRARAWILASIEIGEDWLVRRDAGAGGGEE